MHVCASACSSKRAKYAMRCSVPLLPSSLKFGSVCCDVVGHGVDCFTAVSVLESTSTLCYLFWVRVSSGT